MHAHERKILITAIRKVVYVHKRKVCHQLYLRVLDDKSIVQLSLGYSEGAFWYSARLPKFKYLSMSRFLYKLWFSLFPSGFRQLFYYK